MLLGQFGNLGRGLFDSPCLVNTPSRSRGHPAFGGSLRHDVAMETPSPKHSREGSVVQGSGYSARKLAEPDPNPAGYATAFGPKGMQELSAHSRRDTDRRGHFQCTDIVPFLDLRNRLEVGPEDFTSSSANGNDWVLTEQDEAEADVPEMDCS